MQRETLRRRAKATLKYCISALDRLIGPFSWPCIRQRRREGICSILVAIGRGRESIRSTAVAISMICHPLADILIARHVAAGLSPRPLAFSFHPNRRSIFPLTAMRMLATCGRRYELQKREAAWLSMKMLCHRGRTPALRILHAECVRLHAPGSPA